MNSVVSQKPTNRRSRISSKGVEDDNKCAICRCDDEPLVIITLEIQMFAVATASFMATVPSRWRNPDFTIIQLPSSGYVCLKCLNGQETFNDKGEKALYNHHPDAVYLLFDRPIWRSE